MQIIYKIAKKHKQKAETIRRKKKTMIWKDYKNKKQWLITIKKNFCLHLILLTKIHKIKKKI